MKKQYSDIPKGMRDAYRKCVSRRRSLLRSFKKKILLVVVITTSFFVLARIVLRSVYASETVRDLFIILFGLLVLFWIYMIGKVLDILIDFKVSKSDFESELKRFQSKTAPHC